MRIAILYICTGRYTIFWDGFFRSCEAYFLPDYERHYFVFTDGHIALTDNERVHRIEQENLGWPGNTLFRFRMFWNIRGQLETFDYIFFFNANCEFLAPVGEEFLPSEEEDLTVVRHPGFFDKAPDDVSYERNPKSRAYIPFGQGRYYICGGINGGRREAWLALINTLREAIDEDEANGVVALWHDESHLNKYILTHPHKLLPPAYCHPEGWNIPYEQIIRVRDKFKHGSLAVLRGEKELTDDAPDESRLLTLWIMHSLRQIKGIGRRMLKIFRFCGRMLRLKQAVRWISFLAGFRAAAPALADGRFACRWKDRWPCLDDATGTTAFDAHYVYHTAWAARILAETRPVRHVDIGSCLRFVTLTSAFVPVEFYDYRPAIVFLSGLACAHADAAALPFADASIASISCMHVVEHIGLERYGDPFDPQGDLKAMQELTRVLAPGGQLLFVVPLGGEARIQYNAHRIYTYAQILSYFSALSLDSFAFITESGQFLPKAGEADTRNQQYGCGCFRFVRHLADKRG